MINENDKKIYIYSQQYRNGTNSPTSFYFLFGFFYSNFNLNHLEPSIVANKSLKIAGITLSKLPHKNT